MEYYTTKNGSTEISYTIDKMGNEWLVQTKSGIIRRFNTLEDAEKLAIKKLLSSKQGE